MSNMTELVCRSRVKTSDSDSNQKLATPTQTSQPWFYRLLHSKELLTCWYSYCRLGYQERFLASCFIIYHSQIFIELCFCCSKRANARFNANSERPCVLAKSWQRSQLSILITLQFKIKFMPELKVRRFEGQLPVENFLFETNVIKRKQNLYSKCCSCSANLLCTSARRKLLRQRSFVKRNMFKSQSFQCDSHKSKAFETAAWSSRCMHRLVWIIALLLRRNFNKLQCITTYCNVRSQHHHTVVATKCLWKRIKQLATWSIHIQWYNFWTS